MAEYGGIREYIFTQFTSDPSIHPHSGSHQNNVWKHCSILFIDKTQGPHPSVFAVITLFHSVLKRSQFKKKHLRITVFNFRPPSLFAGLRIFKVFANMAQEPIKRILAFAKRMCRQAAQVFAHYFLQEKKRCNISFCYFNLFQDKKIIDH